MKEYTPRRANLTRWLQGAPDYILDVLDSKNDGERYTVIFTKALAVTTGSFADTYLSFLGMSESLDVSMWGELKAYECAQYRQHCKRHRIKWTALPEHIRAHVISRATSD